MSRIVTMDLYNKPYDFSHPDAGLKDQFEVNEAGKTVLIEPIQRWIHENDFGASVVTFSHHITIRFSTPEKATLFKMFYT